MSKPSKKLMRELVPLDTTEAREEALVAALFSIGEQLVWAGLGEFTIGDLAKHLLKLKKKKK